MTAGSGAVYAGHSLEELERQYDVEATVPDLGAYLSRFSEMSAAVRARRSSHLDIAYGDNPAERLDLFPADAAGAGPAPVVLFIHGGAWRSSNKESRAFPADFYCPAGAAYISVEYPLAPAHGLDEMAAAVLKALAWTRRNAATFGADPERIVVVGNSAGGHLAASAATSLGAARPAGLVTISGVFEMKPLQLTRANSWLKMDDAMVERHSPIRHIPERGCPLVAFFGENEPDEFRRQSCDFAAAWQARGGEAAAVPVPGHNHFSIIGLAGEAGNPISETVLRMAGL